MAPSHCVKGILRFFSHIRIWTWTAMDSPHLDRDLTLSNRTLAGRGECSKREVNSKSSQCHQVWLRPFRVTYYCCRFEWLQSDISESVSWGSHRRRCLTSCPLSNHLSQVQSNLNAYVICNGICYGNKALSFTTVHHVKLCILYCFSFMDLHDWFTYIRQGCITANPQQWVKFTCTKAHPTTAKPALSV